MNGGNKKALVIYHRVDYDGLFSYAIAKRALEKGMTHTDTLYDVTGFGYNHSDTLDELPSFENFDIIVIADIALPSDKMVEAGEKYSNKIIWIDHHITTINDSIEKGYGDRLMGVRRDGVAACKLCWEYFMGTENQIPTAVDLVATNDIWDHATYDWENDVQPLQYGLSLHYKMDAELVASKFETIIDTYQSIQNDGKLLKTYMDGIYKTWCERYAFPVTIDGKWKGICMICPMFTSKVFDSLSADYDCCVVIEKNGHNEGMYHVSMYSDKNIPELSCGDYMKKNYGGGGHKGAAGGLLTLDQFTKILSEHTL